MSHDSDRDDHGSLLGGLLEAIRRAAEANDGTYSTSGRVDRRAGRIDFGYSVRTGLGPGASGRKGHPSFGDSAPSGEASNGGHRPIRVVPENGDASDGDGRIVTVDIRGTGAADVDSVTVSIDGSTVTVVADGVALAATRLADDGPWTVVETDVRNGVFEAVVRPA